MLPLNFGRHVLIRLCRALVPSSGISPKLREAWRKREDAAFRKNSLIFLSFFAVAYVAHFLFVDIPLRKTPLELWAVYRFGCAISSLIALVIVFYSERLPRYSSQIAVILASIVFTVMQASSMTWRVEVPYVYSILIPFFSTLVIRVSVAGSVAYLLTLYAFSVHGWLSRPLEISHILSAAIVGLLGIAIIKGKEQAAIDGFIAEQEKIDALRANAEWAAGVVHDLKGPLFSLRTVEAQLTNEQSEARAIVQACINRVKTIAGQLAVKSRESSQASQIHLLCQSVANELLNEFGDKKNTFSLSADIEARNMVADVDETQMRRVLGNILRNAFESRGSSLQIVAVSVHVSKLNDSVGQVTIADNGAGVPHSLLESLGTRVVVSTKQHGSGVGMFGAATIVRQWGGQITITSPLSSHGGAKIEFTFPLSNS